MVLTICTDYSYSLTMCRNKEIHKHSKLYLIRNKMNNYKKQTNYENNNKKRPHDSTEPKITEHNKPIQTIPNYKSHTPTPTIPVLGRLSRHLHIIDIIDLAIAAWESHAIETSPRERLAIAMVLPNLPIIIHLV